MLLTSQRNKRFATVAEVTESDE